MDRPQTYFYSCAWPFGARRLLSIDPPCRPPPGRAANQLSASPPRGANQSHALPVLLPSPTQRPTSILSVATSPRGGSCLKVGWPAKVSRAPRWAHYWRCALGPTGLALVGPAAGPIYERRTPQTPAACGVATAALAVFAGPDARAGRQTGHLEDIAPKKERPRLARRSPDRSPSPRRPSRTNHRPRPCDRLPNQQ